MKSSNLALRMDPPQLPAETALVSRIAPELLASLAPQTTPERVVPRRKSKNRGIVIRDQGLRLFRVG